VGLDVAGRDRGSNTDDILPSETDGYNRLRRFYASFASFFRLVNASRRIRVQWRYALRQTRRVFRSLSERYEIGDGLVVVLAAVIGVMAGLTVIGFYGLLDWIRSIAGWARETSGGSDLPWLALAVVPGGLWLSTRILADAQDRAMVPTLIRSSVRQGGRLSLVPVTRKLVAAAVTIGAGGSLGAEGPVAVAGALVSSAMSQTLRFSQRRARVLLACGTAAGISAAFNAPIAGVLFALEVVLGTFAVGAMSPVVVASVMGAVVSRRFLGDSPAFAIPSEFMFVSASEFPVYLAFAIACGVLAWAFVRVFYGTQDLLTSWIPSVPNRALVAGLLVAGLGLIHPELLGDGRYGIELVLSAQLAGVTALGLGLAKILSSGLTAAGGGVGGVFTPSLLVGASFGTFFGLSVQQLFPTLDITPEAYALVGMAAVVAGATFAPLTAIIMIFEMTDDYGLILPLMLVTVVSYIVARRLGQESIYSEALARTGDRIVHGADRSALENLRVGDCYDRDPHVVLEDAPVRQLLAQIRGSRQTSFPVVNRELELSGMLGYQEVARALEEGLADLIIAADLQVPDLETVMPGDSLLVAMRKMNLRDVDVLPVVQGRDSRRLSGLLSRADIMEAYQTRLLLDE
jgi:CIC family chloride channel protein